MDEPSLLDLLKAKFTWRNIFRRGPIEIEPEPIVELGEGSESALVVPRVFPVSRIPWRSVLALFLAIVAQSALNPQKNDANLGIFLYIAAAAMLVYAFLVGEWQIQSPVNNPDRSFPLSVNKVALYFFVPSLLLAFLSFGGNQFTVMNLFLWFAAMLSGFWVFWIPEHESIWVDIKVWVKNTFQHTFFSIRIDPWKILLFAVFLTAAFFHFYQLKSLPMEMTSDHTEKLLDVNRVISGDYSIFFATNGGREPIHFYLSALLIQVFNTGFTFFTLKLGMALAFLWSLIYVYKLGTEVGSRWTGLLFVLLIGFAAWPNIIARAGMRMVLTPVFVAPTLFFFLRGLRRTSRNDLILSGIFLGLGLMGYSASRIMPLVLLAGIIIYLFKYKFSKPSRSLIWAFGLTALFSLVLFLPLLRYILENPYAFGARMLTRLTSVEKELPPNLLLVFFQNFWRSAVMPFWKDGSAWVISVPERPALDVITAAFYFLGLISMIYRWIRTRSWQDLFLLISIPLLMLPSILSLAFPDENPSLSRAGGSMIPIFLISAIALETLFTSLWKKSASIGTRVVIVIFGMLLIVLSASNNFDIALRQYTASYRLATWNSSEMGAVVKDFTNSMGPPENVWVVGVPYWVDTRLVAINAGFIGRDFAIWSTDLETTLANDGSKLFIVKADDAAGMEHLKILYPKGFSNYHANPVLGRDFIAFYVLSDSTSNLISPNARIALGNIGENPRTYSEVKSLKPYLSQIKPQIVSTATVPPSNLHYPKSRRKNPISIMQTLEPRSPAETQRLQTSPEKALFLAGHEINRGNSEKQIVMMTYDDGGAESDMDYILRMYESYRVRATFFVTGEWLTKHQDFAKEMIDRGFELACHSWNHSDMTTLSEQEARDQIEKFINLMKDVDPSYTIKFIRFPYGQRNDQLRLIAAEYGLQSVMWSDESGGTTNKALTYILDELKPGSIVLSHSSRKFDINMVKEIITSLRNLGYKLVTVSEGISPNDLYIESGSN
jgi:peptidoglycan/xylan/chitin deacetylase (PgdA/CDA1 family)